MIGPPTLKPYWPTLRSGLAITSLSAHLVADQALVTVEREAGDLPLVGSASGDRVDAGSRESALTHIVRGDLDGHLFHSVERNGLRRRLTTRCRVVEAERVVEVGSVQRDVVVQPVPSAEAEVAVAARIDSREIPCAAAHRRQGNHLRSRDGRGCAGPVAVQDLILVRRYRQRLEFDCRLSQYETEPRTLTQYDVEPFRGAWLMAQQGEGHRVGASNTHAPDREHASSSRDRAVRRAARHVHGRDRRTHQRTRCSVRHHAVDTSRGHALCHQVSARKQNQRHDREERGRVANQGASREGAGGEGQCGKRMQR